VTVGALAAEPSPAFGCVWLNAAAVVAAAEGTWAGVFATVGCGYAAEWAAQERQQVGAGFELADVVRGAPGELGAVH